MIEVGVKRNLVDTGTGELSVCVHGAFLSASYAT